MKLTYLLLLGVDLIVVQHAPAQDTASHRLVISISGGAFLPQRPGRNVVESFAYTTTPVGAGISSSGAFSGSLGGDFLRVDYVGDIMNFEVTSYHHAINGGFGLFQTSNADDGGYFKGGYARVLRFQRNRFRFEPGIDLYGVLGSQVEMGRIDNRNQTLQLLGYTAAPQWTVRHGDRSGTYSTTYTADHLGVFYRRNALLVKPKLGLDATLGRLVLGLEAGWMLQLSQGCVVVFKQEDGSGNSNTIGRMHEPHNGSLSGFYTSLSVGWVYRSRQLFKR